MKYPVIVTALASAVRAATTIANVQNILFPQVNLGEVMSPAPPLPACAILAYLNVTAVPGVDTVLLQLQELEPVTQTWVDVAGAATLAQVAAGLIVFRMAEHVNAVAASASGVTVNGIIPANWRFRVVHSGAGNFTYSLAVVVEN